MREIKFRAWCPEKNAFADRLEIFDDGSFLTIFGEEGNQIYGGNDDDVLMQYTGLKDSTGKEIYEGDIITSNYHNDLYDYGFDLTSLVEFRNGCFWLNVHNCELHYYNEFSIVIGNIYENPELIEVKND